MALFKDKSRAFFRQRQIRDFQETARFSAPRGGPQDRIGFSTLAPLAEKYDMLGLFKPSVSGELAATKGSAPRPECFLK